MTSPSEGKPSLINIERMNRQVICINPTHDTVTLNTTETQPKCPICDNVMVTVVKSMLADVPLDTDKE